MLTAAGSALVRGASPEAPMEKMKVRVLRAFLLRGERQEVGKELEMDRRLAAELSSYNKVAFVPASAPVTQEPAKAPVPKPALKKEA